MLLVLFPAVVDLVFCRWCLSLLWLVCGLVLLVAVCWYCWLLVNIVVCVCCLFVFLLVVVYCALLVGCCLLF